MSTGIQWTDETWNPVRGCTRVSAGCVHCYAETIAHRFSGPGLPYEGLTTNGRWNSQIRVVPAHMIDPVRWRRPRRIFVNSMSDLFHANVPLDVIDTVFAVMHVARHHQFQVLTKRPEGMQRYMADPETPRRIDAAVLALMTDHVEIGGSMCIMQRDLRVRDAWVAGPAPDLWPPTHVALGVSVENQATADERIPLLLATPASLRFISAEPLLGRLSLLDYLYTDLQPTGDFRTHAGTREMRFTHGGRSGLGWVICGGESGPGARPCDVAWVRSIVQQCAAAGVPCFVKQLGQHVIDRNDAGFEGDPGDAWTPETRYEDRTSEGWQGDPVRVRLRARKGDDMAEWPEDLRVRQYPAEVRACLTRTERRRISHLWRKADRRADRARGDA